MGPVPGECKGRQEVIRELGTLPEHLWPDPSCHHRAVPGPMGSVA